MAMTTSSAPSLQVDLPGLSQLILNVGSHGLKQLAMAGVDIHSIGCMLMIAEYTPASPEFRKKINLARNAQRSERLWLYKVVEIGASTNFLADQLLKTRGGENVLALMAATVPVMDEETCTTALVALFEGAKVSLDNIPGLSQLRSLRTDLAPLSRRVGFGEKVLNYHKFLWSLCHDQHPATMPKDGPYSAIPLAADIASIIRMLHRIVCTEEPYIFICWGFRGAAWITAYASEVLGLKVCAVQNDKTPIPVTGAYEDAKILIELSSTQNKCGLYLKKNLEEQFELSRENVDDRRGWSVDCAVVHFLEYRHSKIGASDSLKRLSAFTAIETLNKVSALSSSISAWTENRMVFQNANMTGFVTYAESELRHTQARSLRILRQLGFVPGSLDDYLFSESEECPTYICDGHSSDPPQSSFETDDEVFDYDLNRKVKRRELSMYGQYVFPGAAFGVTDTNRIGRYIADPNIYKMDDVPSGFESGFHNNFIKLRLDKQEEISETVRIASHFASYLAFSDWDVSLRQMSVRFLQYGETQGQHQSESGCFEAHMSSAIPLCADNLDLSTLENKLWSADWVALDLDGIIVHRNTARHYSINELRGKFLGFTAGRIVSDGENCSKVRSDRVGLSYLDSASEVDAQRIEACVPKLKFRNLSVRTLLSTVKDTLFVRLEGFSDSKLILVGDASRVGQTLPDTLVSVSCPHGYSKKTSHGLDDLTRDTNTLQTDRIHMIIASNALATDRIRVIEGLVFDANTFAPSPRRKEKLHIYYQSVDNSPLGQWLASHWTSPNQRALTIIQKDCCFGCILQRTRRLYEMIEDSVYPLPAEGLDVCIIPSGEQQPARPQHAISSAGTLPIRASASGAPSPSLHPPRGVQTARSSENLLRPSGRSEASHRRAVSSDSAYDTRTERQGGRKEIPKRKPLDSDSN